MTPEAIKQTLEQHRLWLRGKGGGRANLRGANLSQANLSGADLRGANLFRANLSWADLSGADLSGADLSEASLRWSNPREVNLYRANLYRADLYGSNLYGADLHRADLREANLPAPTTVLLAWWGNLPPDLCALAMAYDAACHPNPQAFTDWAKGGPCPYDGARFQRACSFLEDRAHWRPGLNPPRPWDLMVALIRHCCADSDFHGKQEKREPVLCPDWRHAR